MIAHNKQIAMVILLQKAIDCSHYQITINTFCPLPVLIVGNLHRILLVAPQFLADQLTLLRPIRLFVNESNASLT